MTVTPLRRGDGLDLSELRAALYNADAEQRLLGACLIDNRRFGRVTALVREEHFGNALHGRIFSAIGVLIARGEIANPVTLGPTFDQDPTLKDTGGAKYLIQLAASAADVTDARDYAAHVADLSRRRAIVAECEDTIRAASKIDPERRAAGIAAEHVARIAEFVRGGSRLEIVDPGALQGLLAPERQWLVLDWVPMARVTALYGAGGEGKTRLAQMLATACALVDAQWVGLSVRHCNSLLVFCEDDQDEMHRRQAEINEHYGCSFSDLTAMRWLPRLGADNALMTFEGRPAQTAFYNELRDAAKFHNAKLVVVDTLADVFQANENDRSQARAFAQQALGALAREINGSVIALAHPSRSGITSGSGESDLLRGSGPSARNCTSRRRGKTAASHPILTFVC